MNSNIADCVFSLECDKPATGTMLLIRSRLINATTDFGLNESMNFTKTCGNYPRGNLLWDQSGERGDLQVLGRGLKKARNRVYNDYEVGLKWGRI